jgi:hypothetical protein
MAHTDLERAILAEVSQDKLLEYTTTIAQWVRLSGSPEERKAFDYAQKELQSYGFSTHLYAADSYISLPEAAKLQILAPEQKDIKAITHSFSLSTPPQGVEGELVYQTYPTQEPQGKVKGKIVLQDGRVMPVKVLGAENDGAIAQIHISGEHLHEMIASPVWGAPTPATAHLLPHTPIISILKKDGEHLQSLLTKGPVRIKLHTKTWTGWRHIPVLIADLPGTVERDTFIMLSGHIDSWYYGAMDNGTANATMLEVGRILAGHRPALRRGLRLAFWSGHSHGRYAGSTWYADHFWEELHNQCAGHVNVDSVGAKGATILSEACTMSEMRDFASAIIAEQTGQTLSGRRFGRAGDQSFWGCGIPSLFMSLSEQPPEDSEAARAFALLTGGPPKTGGLGWWWHTPDDTVDKIDPVLLVRDAKVYVQIITHLCTSAILPYNYAAVADEFARILSDIQSKAGTHFDLGPVLGKVKRFKELSTQLNREKARVSAQGTAEQCLRVNKALMALGRHLIPVNYTSVGLFDHDLATRVDPIPGLQPAAKLASLTPESNEYKFLRTALVRERNKVAHALALACREVENVLAML